MVSEMYFVKFIHTKHEKAERDRRDELEGEAAADAWDLWGGLPLKKQALKDRGERCLICVFHGDAQQHQT